MSSCGGGGACQSHCSRPREEPDADDDSLPGISKLSVVETPEAGDGASPSCSKCGKAPRVYSGMCAACFRAHVFGKFKLAVTNNAMISPTDKLLVAFSGGPASRVVLEFVHEMQYKSFKNWDASRSHALPVFGVGVAFVDERACWIEPSNELEKAIEEMRTIVSDLEPVQKELHFLSIESICDQGSDDGRSRLNDLLHSITDTTGKEDFLHYLRMLTLQKIALDNGYSKIILGTCTSRIARHIISATVKGHGYALPADLQYIDTRWEVPVVLPLRDCLAQELSMLCHFDGLKTLQILGRPCTGINGLVSSFVARLQEENPSREHTILRTAGKLKPFHFNKFTNNSYHDFLPSRLRCKFQNVKHEEFSTEVLCSICGSPLDESDVQKLKRIQGKSQTGLDTFISLCCQSCQFQILPKSEVPLEHFYSLLPKSITLRTKDSAFRKQIQDWLISDVDEDDGS